MHLLAGMISSLNKAFLPSFAGSVHVSCLSFTLTQDCTPLSGTIDILFRLEVRGMWFYKANGAVCHLDEKLVAYWLLHELKDTREKCQLR